MFRIKLTHKYGEDTIKALNEALVLKLKESKVVNCALIQRRWNPIFITLLIPVSLMMASKY